MTTPPGTETTRLVSLPGGAFFEVLATLESIGCTFWACTGPQEQAQPMVTCTICLSITVLRTNAGIPLRGEIEECECGTYVIPARIPPGPQLVHLDALPAPVTAGQARETPGIFTVTLDVDKTPEPRIVTPLPDHPGPFYRTHDCWR